MTTSRRSSSRLRRQPKPQNKGDEDDLLVQVNSQVFEFNGTVYDTYVDMVNAKRKRNQQVLLESGLLQAVAQVSENAKQQEKSKKGASALGIKRKTSSSEILRSLPRRKSNRLAGVQSDGAYVEDESGGRFTILGGRNTKELSTEKEEEQDAEPEYYRNRINDGSDLSVEAAVELTGSKWVGEDTVTNAHTFVRETLPSLFSAEKKKTDLHKNIKGARASPRSVASHAAVLDAEGRKDDDVSSFLAQINTMAVDDEGCVAKVCPERIYGIAAHPSTNQLVVSAGDKQGFVGIWNVDSREKEETPTGSSNSTDGVHLFRFHNGAACSLQWTRSGEALFSTSYDGTVRWFDVATETFQELFATYDSSAQYKRFPGSGMDTGYQFWTQYGCLDDRFQSDQCFFLSTSKGTVMHADMRARQKGRVTFHEKLSEKKINTLSLHPNGYSLVTGGLDCQVSLWDVRKFSDNRSSSKRSSNAMTPISYFQSRKSVNSAFFSPSGQYVLSTTMDNRLDLFENMHLTKERKIQKPTTIIRHDNHTGRWLSTFMAQWHPSPDHDVFSVGSMGRPRCMEVWNASGECLRKVSGEAMTAVGSRVCFHPSIEKPILVAGNSSGRVTIAR